MIIHRELLFSQRRVENDCERIVRAAESTNRIVEARSSIERLRRGEPLLKKLEREDLEWLRPCDSEVPFS